MYKKCFNDLFFMDIKDICPNNCVPPQKKSIKGTCNPQIGCLCFGATDHDCSVVMKCKSDCHDNGMCQSTGKCGCYPGWNGKYYYSKLLGETCNGKINCPRNCTSAVHGSCQLDGKCRCNKDYTNVYCSEKVVTAPSPAKALAASTKKSASDKAFKKELSRLHHTADKNEKKFVNSAKTNQSKK